MSKTTYPRYHVVVVSKYHGMHGKGSPTAFAIADHEQANRCVSRKYDAQTEADADCARLNAGTCVPHQDVKDRLLKGIS